MNEEKLQKLRQYYHSLSKNEADVRGRDYLEIQRAYIAECWKSAIVLSGGTEDAQPFNAPPYRGID